MAFPRRVIKAHSAGQFRRKFVCFWKHRKEPREMTFMWRLTFPCIFLHKCWGFLFVWLAGEVRAAPLPRRRAALWAGDQVPWAPGGEARGFAPSLGSISSPLGPARLSNVISSPQLQANFTPFASLGPGSRCSFCLRCSSPEFVHGGLLSVLMSSWN